MRKNVNAAIIMVLVACHLVTRLCPEHSFGYSEACFWQHFYFAFFHSSVFHLLANALPICAMRFRSKSEIAIAYAANVLASFIIADEVPTEGISGMLYFIIGERQYSLLKARRFKCLAPSLAYLAAGFFLPNVNASLHVACLLSGMLHSHVVAFLKRVSNDCRRIGI